MIDKDVSRSLYRVVMVKVKQNKEYDYVSYKELLAEDEEDAVYRWATLFLIPHSEIRQVSPGHWTC